jgi:hypothetical protein
MTFSYVSINTDIIPKHTSAEQTLDSFIQMSCEMPCHVGKLVSIDLFSTSDALSFTPGLNDIVYFRAIILIEPFWNPRSVPLFTIMVVH